MTTQLIRVPGADPAGAGARPGWMSATVVGLLLGMGIFLLYFVTYPVRHLTLPAGFDPSYYVWRAQHLAAEGIGTGLLATRPGYPILSALFGALTGRSQLDMTIVLSMALVPVLALSVGAFVAAGVDRSRLGWAVAVASVGVVVGATQLVGENLANVLNIALEVAALVPLSAAVAGDQPTRGLVAAVALLVASGMSHWLFLPLFFAVLALVFLFSFRGSVQEWKGGLPLWRTESGLLAATGAVAAVITALLIAVVLRAPFRTIEIALDNVLIRRKLRTDVVRLLVPGILGLVGIGWMPAVRRRARDHRSAFLLRVLTAWTWVMGVGLVFAIITWFLPPTRFLAHLVALTGAVTVGTILTLIARWLLRRDPGARRAPVPRAVLAGFVLVASLALISLPGLIRWYPYPILMSEQTLAESRSAARYVSELPTGRPVMFLTDYFGGRPGVYATVLIERTLKIAMTPPHDVDVYVFPGTLEDLLAGRRTPPPGARADRITRPYWEDDERVLPGDPPVLVLQSTGAVQFADALSHGATIVAPGVAKVRGPEVTLAPPAPTRSGGPAASSLGGGLLWGTVALAVMAVVGTGWTRLVLGPGASPEVFVSLAPAVGSAALILGGLAAAEAGVRPSGAGGVLVVAAVAAIGWVGAAFDRR